MLRASLDDRGYAHVNIVAPDSASWHFIDDFLSDPELAKAVDIIGQVQFVILLGKYSFV